MKNTIAFFVLTIASFTLLYGQNVIVSTLAGSGIPGAADGQGTAASFDQPHSVAVDASGNVYVTEREKFKIRKITPSGLVSTFAGSNWYGTADGQGAAASFFNPIAITIDVNGNLYVVDGDRIRKITPSGLVSTIADNCGFLSPMGIAVDATGNLYVADYGNNIIRKITQSGLVNTFSASFDEPRGVAVDANGNVYATDLDDGRIYKITPSGLASILAGDGGYNSEDGECTTAGFILPYGVAIDASGNVYVAELGGSKIRKITPDGWVSTLAGSSAGIGTYADGQGTIAKFYNPTGVAVDANDNVYVADRSNNRIRKITIVPTGIENINSTSSVSIYPNPTSGIINLDLGGLKNASLKVYNTLGQIIVLKENINTTTYQFEINSGKGIYFIELRAQDEVKCFKVIKD